MQRRYVGIDLHRRRSVIFTMDGDGNKLGCRRIFNEAAALLDAVNEFATDPEVVIEATYGWYWAVDLLQDNGLSVHLAHPSGVSAEDPGHAEHLVAYTPPDLPRRLDFPRKLRQARGLRCGGSLRDWFVETAGVW